MVAELMTELMTTGEVADELAALTGVSPSAVRLRVLHAADFSGTTDAQRMADAETGLGWTARLAADGSALRRQWRHADVVVLHGPVAGLVGRLVVRGRVATVLAPPADAWWPRPVSWLFAVWERWAARWTNAVLLAAEGPAAARWRRSWVPPFVVGDRPDQQAALLARAHSYGWPGAAERLHDEGDLA